jgi:hypothetical protein
MVHRDGFELMLSLAEREQRPSPNGPGGTWDVYMRVGDLSGEQEALEAGGVARDRGPTDTEYDMRELEIVDPDGYRWCIGQDTSEMAKAEVWEGVLDVGKARLRLLLKLSGAAGGEVRGLLDSIDQGAMNLPVENVTRDAATLRSAMSAIGASHEGTIGEDGAISGTWSQRGQSWPLAWRRAAS